MMKDLFKQARISGFGRNARQRLKQWDKRLFAGIQNGVEQSGRAPIVRTTPARAAILIAFMLVSMGASYRTPNFTIETASPQMAEEFGKAAEKHRRDLAVSWLGHVLPQWYKPCSITVQGGRPQNSTGVFTFRNGEVFGWRMNLFGTRQEVLDNILPHEITHTILASHFRRPLPRWADEGAALSAESASEIVAWRQSLVQYLKTKRGIAFNRMFAMTEYPRDLLPLYAQGYALTDFLIRQSGRREFIKYLEDGLESDQWAVTTKDHYGYGNLGELQNAWVAWVGRDFPAVTPSPEGHIRLVGYGDG